MVKKCDHVTVVGRSLFDHVRSYGRKRPTDIIINGVDQALFHPMDKSVCRKALNIPGDGVVIGTVGALYENRGIANLFQAFFLLQQKIDHLFLVLAGPRDIPLPTEEAVRDLGIVDQDKVPEILNALDIAVICNADNPFGRYCFPAKAMEIMGCDIPLVASDVGSMGDFFKTHPHWLYKHDDPADLAKKIAARLNDRQTGYTNISWDDLGEVFLTIIGRLAGPK